MLKRLWRLVALVTMIVLAYGLCEQASALYRTGVAYGLVDPVALARYRLYAAGIDRFTAEIEAAITSGDYAYAAALYDLGVAHGHDLPPDLKERAEATVARRAAVSGWRAAKGFVFGSVDTGEELAGTLVSDLVGVGDLRDFSVEGFKYVSGDDYDPVLLGFSAVGLGLTAATIGTASLAAPADAGLSAVKSAYRAGRMSKPLRAYFARNAARVVDTSVLKAELTLAGEGGSALARLERAAAKSVDRTAARALMKDVEVLDDMRRAGGLRAPFAALSIADGPKDLRKLQRVSAHFGENGAVLMKFLGKSVLRIGSGLYEIAMAAISFVLMLLATLVRWPARLALRRVFSRWPAGAPLLRALRPVLRSW